MMHDMKTNDVLFITELEKMWTVFERQNARPSIQALFAFTADWIKVGKPMSNDNLTRIRAFVNEKFFYIEGEGTDKGVLLRAIEDQLVSQSPILGRWRVKSPREDVLHFTSWNAGDISKTLTVMCMSFFRLRAWEFDESSPGPHLKDLNRKCTTLSHFVSLSILAACCVSRDKAVDTAELWLSVGRKLLEMRNFHMAFAVQLGFAKFQVDRLSWLWKSLRRKAAKEKEQLNEFFDPGNRMQKVVETMLACAGKEPMIPCIFWLVQKALLLLECPLVSDGKLNMSRVVAASNIFKDLLVTSQTVRYEELKEDEQILFYFQRLERGSVDTVGEEGMDALSSHVKIPPTATDLAIVNMEGDRTAVPLQNLVNVILQHTEHTSDVSEASSSGATSPNVRSAPSSPRLGRSTPSSPGMSRSTAASGSAGVAQQGGNNNNSNNADGSANESLAVQAEIGDAAMRILRGKDITDSIGLCHQIISNQGSVFGASSMLYAE